MRKHKNKTILMILIISLCLMSFAGCKKKKGEPEETLQPQTPVSAEETSEPTAEPEESVTPEASYAAVEQKDVVIYTINDETLEKEQETVSIPADSKMSSQFVVDLVSKSLSEHSIEIGINSVVQEGDTVVVDFKKEYPPLYNVGAGIELNILDCISMSLLDNADECKKVIFRVDGKAYESGHMVFEYDEVYKWK